MDEQILEQIKDAVGFMQDFEDETHDWSYLMHRLENNADELTEEELEWAQEAVEFCMDPHEDETHDWEDVLLRLRAA